jgi:hypothetical protein
MGQLRMRINGLRLAVSAKDSLLEGVNHWDVDWCALRDGTQRMELLGETQRELEAISLGTAAASEEDRTLIRLGEDLERVPEQTFRELCSLIENQLTEASDLELLSFGRFVGSLTIPSALGEQFLAAVATEFQGLCNGIRRPQNWGEVFQADPPQVAFPNLDQVPHTWQPRALPPSWQAEIDQRWQRLDVPPAQRPQLSNATTCADLVDGVRDWIVPYLTRNYLRTLPRLILDKETFTITLDGHSFPDLDPVAFLIIEALWEARPTGMSSGELEKLPGLCGKKFSRELHKLPPALRDLVKGVPGYLRYIRLPEIVVPGCP